MQYSVLGMTAQTVMDTASEAAEIESGGAWLAVALMLLAAGALYLAATMGLAG